MQKQCLVAVYPSRNEAEQAVRAALGSGIPNDNIRVSGAAREPHVWDWLFSRHVPERDRTYYRTHLAEGRTALSVLLDGGASPARIKAVEENLERYHPVDVHVETTEEAAAAGAAGAAGAPGAAGAKARSAVARKGEEEIIPLPREELKVDTRATDRVRHIRTYVVEEPVEKEVSLSDEQLIVERRAATRGATTGEISERDYEYHERHEEPVVEKTLTGDELVVHKETRRHTERVRGTVRRTEAEIEKQRTGAGIQAKDRRGR